MIDATEILAQRLSSLRSEFDHVFGEPPAEPPGPREDLLAIVLQRDSYAIRLREVRGLYVDPRIVSVPTASADGAGLAAIRGELVAIYDLALLLGYEACEAPRYVLLAKTPGLGFAVGDLRGHLRVPISTIRARPQNAEGLLVQVVQEAGLARPIIELAALAALISARIRVEPRQEI
jgi:chemotaxis signal transduction protein